MTAVQDPMKRLAAADPAADAERLGADEQREADALLARVLTAPVKAVAARPRRRWPRLAGATAAAAVAVFAALSLFDSGDGPTPNVLAKAVAALTQKDTVYHAIAVGSLHSTEFREPHPKHYDETWHTTRGRLHRRAYGVRDGRRGQLLGDFAGQRRPGRLGGPALAYDAHTNTIRESGFGSAGRGSGAPGFDPFDPGTSLRELQAGGRLHLAGEVRVDGRRAYRLVSGNVKGSGGSVERSEILVDAKSYLPRELRFFVRTRLGTTRVVWRYVKYERLPLNKRTSALLDFDPPSGAKCAPGTEHIDRKGSLGFPNPCAR